MPGVFMCWNGRPFHVLKDANNKYFIEANSLQRHIDSCPDFQQFIFSLL